MLKRKNQNNNKKVNKSQLIIVGSLFILLGIELVGGKYLYNYFQDKKENNLIEEFYEEQQDVDELVNEEVPTEQEVKEIQPVKQNTPNYIAVIKIPKIGIEKGLCEKGSYCNNVNRNIEFLKESNYPDKEKGNVILAAHSGSGRVAYFRNVDKLAINDEIFVVYGGFQYKYKIVNIYDIEKTGTANIKRNNEKNTLTLVTCRHNTNKQIIVISELIERIEYSG